jgi:hypothetical protein
MSFLFTTEQEKCGNTGTVPNPDEKCTMYMPRIGPKLIENVIVQIKKEQKNVSGED